MKTLSVAEYFNRDPGLYAAGVTRESEITALLDMAMQVSSPANVLDVGIGPGLRWQFRKVAKITGIDCSEGLLDICRAKITKDVHCLDVADTKKP